MNADEFAAMRARKDIPHDDEICWDAHDRTPDRTTASSQPSRWMFIIAMLAVILSCVVMYYWR
jgi:hypothetical protein